LADGVTSLVAAPADVIIGAADVLAVRCPDIPLYLLFRALLI
jgi:hypothetical protein